MRTLLMTQVVPNPPDAGPKAKTHYVLRTLAKEHEVDLVTFVRSEAEIQHAKALAPYCRSIATVPIQRGKVRDAGYLAKSWLKRTPFLVERDARRAYSTIVSQLMASGDIDVMHADQLSMAQYLDLGRGHRARRVFDAHNAVWELVHELAPRQPTPVHQGFAAVEWRRLRQFEGRIARESDLTLVVSERDRSALSLAAGTEIRTEVVPIGIEALERDPVDLAGTANLLSIATMHYPPNAEALRWFLDSIWPRVATAVPNATLDIVGTRPPQDLSAAAELDTRVRVRGYVENVEPLYQEAAVFIAPLRSGSGVRVKILEAMARGVPVVSTTIGADGLDVHDGVHLLLADTPQEFAEAIRFLIANPARARAIATTGRQRVIERYDWRNCCRPVLDAYRQLIPAKAASVYFPVNRSTATPQDVT